MGSIGDNKLGGWISYRASKAATNMLVRCAAIELRARNVGVIALHPNLVDTALSQPITQNSPNKFTPLTPDQSAAMLHDVCDTAVAEQRTGVFLDYEGKEIEW